MASFLGIKSNKWISIMFLLAVLIICLGLSQFTVFFGYNGILTPIRLTPGTVEGFKEGLISQDNINTINCAFQTYISTVDALCLYHITGQVPSSNGANIEAYLLKSGSSLQNIGLSATEGKQSTILQAINQITASGTNQTTPSAAMMTIYKLYTKDKKDLQIMSGVMTAHYAARVALLTNFLNHLQTIIPANSSEDTNFSTMISNGLTSPIIYAGGASAERDTFTSLQTYFKSTYNGQIDNSFRCPALTL